MKNQPFKLWCILALVMLTQLSFANVVNKKNTVAPKFEYGKKYQESMRRYYPTTNLYIQNTAGFTISYLSVSGQDYYWNPYFQERTTPLTNGGTTQFDFLTGANTITLTMETSSTSPEYFVEVRDASENVLFNTVSNASSFTFTLPETFDENADYLTVQFGF
jgi:hypothetical protein